MTMHVASLWRYPVKSLAGDELARAEVESRGIAGDRRWMMTTPEGRFLTRRELPAMAGLHAAPTVEGLVLTDRTGATLTVAMPRDVAPVPVRVWDDAVTAQDAGEEAAQWLSARVERPARLVYMPDTAVRPVHPGFSREGDKVGFADGFPLLVCVVESLDALNRQLAAPIAMARFRPNLVIAGAPRAFAEDDWHVLAIGNLSLRLVQPCTRCVITTQDPASGMVVEPMQPLRTLRAMGRVMPGEKREPIFGQNAIPDNAATIAVGDEVRVVG
jgi:uncharacterized protein YcbX